jgi:hypothetical protein
VEAVIGAHVHIALVRHVCSRERGVKSRPSRRDVRVEFAVVRKQRRLDLGRLIGARLAAVERNRVPWKYLLDEAEAFASCAQGTENTTDRPIVTSAD